MHCVAYDTFFWIREISVAPAELYAGAKIIKIIYWQ